MFLYVNKSGMILVAWRLRQSDLDALGLAEASAVGTVTASLERHI
jgi:hypothetical protein